MTILTQLKMGFVAAVIGGVVAVAGVGAAYAKTCPAIPYIGQTRTITLTPDANVVGCYAYGEGNIGNGPNDPLLFGSNGGNTFVLSGPALIPGLMEISDTGGGDPNPFLSGTTNSGNNGNITVAAGASSFSRLVLGLKFGTGGQGPNAQSPDWVAFEISGPGTYTFSQNINSHELSHTVLYGAMAAIPLPAAGFLLLGALGGLGIAGRRKRKTS